MNNIEELIIENERLKRENKSLLNLIERMHKSTGLAISKFINGESIEKKKKRNAWVPELARAIWEITPRKGRSRSSKTKLESALRNTPAEKMISHEGIIESLKSWCESEDWTKSKGEYVFGIDRWVRERRWENTPEKSTKKKNPHGITSV